jgi:hypothetical protein
MDNQSNLSNYQKSLNDSADSKKRFLESEGISESESSESEKEVKVQKTVTKHRKVSNGIDMLLMEQYIQQQQQYLKAQKTIYKLKNEIDTEEVRSRYLKLDLNNAQVKIVEMKQKLLKNQNNIHRSTVINIFLFVSTMLLVAKMII